MGRHTLIPPWQYHRLHWHGYVGGRGEVMEIDRTDRLSTGDSAVLLTPLAVMNWVSGVSPDFPWTSVSLFNFTRWNWDDFAHRTMREVIDYVYQRAWDGESVYMHVRALQLYQKIEKSVYVEKVNPDHCAEHCNPTPYQNRRTDDRG